MFVHKILAWNIFSQHWLSGDVDIQLTMITIIIIISYNFLFILIICDHLSHVWVIVCCLVDCAQYGRLFGIHLVYLCQLGLHARYTYDKWIFKMCKLLKLRAANNFPAGAGQIVWSNLFLLEHIPFLAGQTSITSYRYKSTPSPLHMMF